MPGLSAGMERCCWGGNDFFHHRIPSAALRAASHRTGGGASALLAYILGACFGHKLWLAEFQAPHPPLLIATGGITIGGC